MKACKASATMAVNLGYRADSNGQGHMRSLTDRVWYSRIRSLISAGRLAKPMRGGSVCAMLMCRWICPSLVPDCACRGSCFCPVKLQRRIGNLSPLSYVRFSRWQNEGLHSHAVAKLARKPLISDLTQRFSRVHLCGSFLLALMPLLAYLR